MSDAESTRVVVRLVLVRVGCLVLVRVVCLVLVRVGRLVLVCMVWLVLHKKSGVANTVQSLVTAGGGG